MRPAPIRFERSQLYEEVWAQPITHLASKYGLSDNGLRKICNKLSVPVPALVHWAKLAAGHQVSRTPLAPGEGAAFAVAYPPVAAPVTFHDPADEQWLTHALEVERGRPPVRIAPLPRLHPALRELGAALEDAVKEAESARREYDKDQAARAKSRAAALRPNLSALRLHTVLGRGGILLETHKASALRVTSGTFRRALLVLNAIFHAARDRAVEAEHDRGRGRFVLRLERGEIEFAVRERLDEAWRDSVNSWSGKAGKEKYWSPTGRLSLVVYRNGYDGTPFEEDKDGGFGDLSKILFEPLYRRVVACRQARREQVEREQRQEQRRRELAESERQSAEQAAIRAEHERLSAIEEGREKALIEEARRWNDAKILRRCLHARQRCGVDPADEWMEWARAVAERLDPAGGPRTGNSPGAVFPIGHDGRS